MGIRETTPLGGLNGFWGTSCTNDMTIFTSALYIFHAKRLPVCDSLVMISFLTVFFKFFMRAQTINR